MAKRYDPILMMMVEDEATKVQDAVSGFLVMYSKKGNQVTRGIIVKAANSSEARKKFEARKPGFYVHGVEALSDQDVESMKRRGMSVLDASTVDKAIKAMDANSFAYKGYYIIDIGSAWIVKDGDLVVARVPTEKEAREWVDDN